MSGRRKFLGGRVVLATHNPGKVREIERLLAPLGVKPMSAGALGLAEPVEDGATFTDNAHIKALAAARASDTLALADDSGLVVEGLGGAPGVNSARWAGPGKDFRIAMERVERELTAAKPGSRRAHFHASLSLAWPDGHTEDFVGQVHGVLVWPPRGDGGFGYDPIFVPDGHDQTFGELDPDRKHAISHRARAFARLVDGCFH